MFEPDIDPYDDPRISDERYYSEDPALHAQEEQRAQQEAEIAAAVDNHLFDLMEQQERGAEEEEHLRQFRLRCQRARHVGVRNAPILIQGCATRAEAIAKLEAAVRVRRKVSTFGDYEATTKRLEAAIEWLK